MPVRARPTWRAAGQLLACVLLVLASAGFVAGGLLGDAGVGGAAFLALGAVGLVLFGAGTLLSAGALLARRPVLVLEEGGVRRPARWPLPRRADRFLPWDEVHSLAALRRGVEGRRRGEQEHLVFLRSAELTELARTADRPMLVALTLSDIPPSAGLPAGAGRAHEWCVLVQPGWDVTLPELVKQIRARRPLPVVDRRSR
ncbi:hypothetical protein K1Y72_03170 [Actinomadura sp. PM05-2]|uniref:PH domain-containing protein n=1 Tax=Actinomadura parmotrematis TaxID=2864039 RepID=A0ABS7FP58_9ACTN|nr:hypothetical protein [Actinomadura parmotrematis]